MTHTPRLRLFGALAVVALGFIAFAVPAAAQFGPPQTIFGSITDSSGPVADKLPIEAYVADKICGKGVTEFVGDGASRVTVFAVDVVSKEQTAGCGADGTEVRIKIGDRFADQKARWRAGPLQVDLVFGANATPQAIPTFTPAPTTAAPAQPTLARGTPAIAATVIEGTPVAGASATASAIGSVTVSVTRPPNATPTLVGGVISSVTGGTGGSGGGGFPLWGIVVAILGVVAVAGGGVGILMARARARERDAISQI